MKDFFTIITEQLGYNPNSPLIFTNGLFLFLFLGFLIVYYALRNNHNSRLLFVIAFSLYFYFKTSGIYLLLLLFVSLSDFVIGTLIGRSQRQGLRKAFLWLSISINIGLLCYFKYTNFLGSIFSDLFNQPFEFKNIFLPIGISFFVFQSMSYVIDIYRRNLEPLKYYRDYLFYISFFPQLVAGPIVRARDFIPQIHAKPHVTHEMFGEGIFLIATGLFKKAIISDFISLNFVDRVFDNPLLYSGFENLMAIYGYALQIYCDFSGYSDMAIGIALLLGFRFLKNFDSPYKSASITEFWRRWHISLSNWLKDYLYISLGGNRKGRVRTYVNLFLTMLLGGLWHGAALRFVLWGGMHGAALGVHKYMMNRYPSWHATGDQMVWWRRIIGIFVTFNFVCFTWIFFRAESIEVGSQMLSQIALNFQPGVIPQFIVGYRYVIFLILAGYIFHFVSEKWENRAMTLTINSHMAYKLAGIILIIWMIMQVKSSDIQPFIYFQF